MKIELDRLMINNLKDELMVRFLQDDLESVLQGLSVDNHYDDIKYNRKLVKAYIRILKYYGHEDDIE